MKLTSCPLPSPPVSHHVHTNEQMSPQLPPRCHLSLSVSLFSLGFSSRALCFSTCLTPAFLSTSSMSSLAPHPADSHPSIHYLEGCKDSNQTPHSINSSCFSAEVIVSSQPLVQYAVGVSKFFLGFSKSPNLQENLHAYSLYMRHI